MPDDGDSGNSVPSKPLEGIRILDFSHALAGPYCTLLLSDYGAEVYKLESRAGDMGRGWGPPFSGGLSHFFLGLNRGKYGISIDLKEPEGRDLCLRLLDGMDVLIENFRPGSMDRLGLGYETVHKRNPVSSTVLFPVTDRRGHHAMKPLWTWWFRVRAGC
jgi:crotonobetainyl-CoA:carnitine CoA-transferase CaiB-like acyl-CoA transferase